MDGKVARELAYPCVVICTKTRKSRKREIIKGQVYNATGYERIGDQIERHLRVADTVRDNSGELTLSGWWDERWFEPVDMLAETVPQREKRLKEERLALIRAREAYYREQGAGAF